MAFSPEQISQAVVGARAWFANNGSQRGSETAVLSTCNRTELYAVADVANPIDTTAQFLADFHRLPYSELRPHLYTLPQDNAVRHAFRVASGLDSMVLGEPQILGQMKDAVRQTDEAGGLGTYLHQLFQRTFAVAKEARTTTEIGAHSVSMAAAAVRLSQRIFDKISGTIGFVYRCWRNDRTVRHAFCGTESKKITIANRTLERGETFGQSFFWSRDSISRCTELLA